jgi:hypothetical protein
VIVFVRILLLVKLFCSVGLVSNYCKLVYGKFITREHGKTKLNQLKFSNEVTISIKKIESLEQLV